MSNNEFDLYKEYIHQNDVTYDIGAHIGLISVQMKNIGADVYAFEPSSNNFPTLKTNCEGLGIKCFDVAIHEKNYECFTQFKDCKTDYIDKNGKKMDTFQNIKYFTLESFIQENKLPFPSFIKLDIEGMESIVLKTFDFLFERKVKMYIEVHAQPKDMDNQNYKDNPHFIFKEDGGFDFNDLKKYGYKLKIDNRFLSENEDWNPREGFHGNYIII